MRGGTLFSGIGAPECAMPTVDWRWCADIDPFACAVHKARFPVVPNLGDVTRIETHAIEPVDLVVFGSPCQSFSVAGKRLGLDDPRGNMALVGLRVIGRVRPRWVVWENVPGVLSSDGGRDFGTFLGLLGECGYGFAYRVLDAQHFGVPQRRRRVFVIGHLGDWRPAAAVLFEPESLRGDPAPRREAGQRVARPVASCTEGGSGYRNDADRADDLIGFYHTNRQPDFGNYENISPTVKCGSGKGGNPPAVAFGGTYDILGTPATNGARQTDIHSALRSRMPGASEASTTTVVTHSLRADASEDGTGRGTPLIAGPLRSHVRNNSNPTTEAAMHIQSGMTVRRLTPRECERLQGFPDDYTLVPYRGKPAADGPRYRAIGNSMAVPVMRWILSWLREVDALQPRLAA